jgi:phage terminase Nu1 subunit (DNA packaging protein)
MASQKTIAVHLFLTSSRVSDLQNMGVIARGCEVDTAREQYINFLRDAAVKRQATVGGQDLQEEQTRLVHHKANIESIKEEEKVGSLIAADSVKTEWLSMVMAMKAKILGLGKKVASTGLGITNYTEMEELVDSYVRESLEELSKDER